MPECHTSIPIPTLVSLAEGGTTYVMDGNSHGVIVGSTQIEGQLGDVPTVWFEGVAYALEDLAELGIIGNVGLTVINDEGMIVGRATNASATIDLGIVLRPI